MLEGLFHFFRRLEQEEIDAGGYDEREDEEMPLAHSSNEHDQGFLGGVRMTEDNMPADAHPYVHWPGAQRGFSRSGRQAARAARWQAGGCLRGEATCELGVRPVTAPRPCDLGQ